MISLIKKTLIYLIIVVQFISFSSARFACLNQNDRITCHCDEDEKIIDCNSLGLIKFPVINETLKGFVGLTLAHNDIQQNTIPWERDILLKLPDLTVSKPNFKPFDINNKGFSRSSTFVELKN